MPTEVWKPVAEYEGIYEVSNTGKVRGRHGELKPWLHNGKVPYKVIGLCKQGKSKKRFVHRLVALAFIDNPRNCEQVNHIDGNYHNNSVENLEWCTNAENTTHAYKNHLRTKRVIWVKDDGELITLRAACKKHGLDYKKVHARVYELRWSIEKAMEYKVGDQS
jgi:hypothetical protein